MQALLGKITGINCKSTGEGTAVIGNGHTPPRPGDLTSLEIKFKAACVLPQRSQVPEWLKDQVLTLSGKSSIRERSRGRGTASC